MKQGQVGAILIEFDSGIKSVDWFRMVETASYDGILFSFRLFRISQLRSKAIDCITEVIDALVSVKGPVTP